MRTTTIALIGIATGVIFALSECRAIAEALDPLQVMPDQPTILTSARRAVITVSGPTFPPRGTRVSLIAYAPDGTMLKRPRRRLLRNGQSKIRLELGEHAQGGTYTVYATVESGSHAFGMPTTFTAVQESPTARGTP